MAGNSICLNCFPEITPPSNSTASEDLFCVLCSSPLVRLNNEIHKVSTSTPVTICSSEPQVVHVAPASRSQALAPRSAAVTSDTVVHVAPASRSQALAPRSAAVTSDTVVHVAPASRSQALAPRSAAVTSDTVAAWSSNPIWSSNPVAAGLAPLLYFSVSTPHFRRRTNKGMRRRTGQRY